MYNGINTSQVVDITGGGAPVVGTWYHLAVVYDGTNALFYVNGALAGQQSAAAYAPNASGPLSRLSVGICGIPTRVRFSIAIANFYNFVLHVFFGKTAAAFIGWQDSPFQAEVGFFLSLIMAANVVLALTLHPLMIYLIKPKFISKTAIGRFISISWFGVQGRMN